MNKKRIKELFEKVINNYRKSEKTVINEYCTNRKKALKNLDNEISQWEHDLKVLLREKE